MMNAIISFWQNFARYVKHGHAQPLPIVLQPIPIESWAERKRAYERAQRAHHGQRDAYAHLRKGTNAALIQQIFADEAKCLRIVETHPWLIRDPDAFVAAVKAVARRRVAEARR